jgi:hypothetical protein
MVIGMRDTGQTDASGGYLRRSDSGLLAGLRHSLYYMNDSGLYSDANMVCSPGVSFTKDFGAKNFGANTNRAWRPAVAVNNCRPTISSTPVYAQPIVRFINGLRYTQSSSLTPYS